MLPQQRLTLKQFIGYYFIISPIYNQQTAGNWAKCQISSQLQKTQPASRGTAELRVPCRLSGGKLALHIKEGRNDNFVTVLYLLLVGLLRVRSRTQRHERRPLILESKTWVQILVMPTKSGTGGSGLGISIFNKGLQVILKDSQIWEPLG